MNLLIFIQHFEFWGFGSFYFIKKQSFIIAISETFSFELVECFYAFICVKSNDADSVYFVQD
ncbi:hypothetical protein BpHYR1_011031 [Brachionus plicatilis]|uniref:Uncharacterized protein n=1 Tax=Brachionus plicatilis TaxID=10195 RepID=A0A3M7QC56_BRAPC|nr:hypothetical protein BpHYR1_011031 [Brachionus plicatilis]